MRVNLQRLRSAKFQRACQLWRTKGNEVTIQVTENVLDSSKRDVVTYVGTDIVDKQVVTDVKELKQNKYVSFSGEGEVTITAGVTLSGGKNGVPSVADYTAFRRS